MVDKTPSTAQRRELGAFLMSRRARVKPHDVGLPAGRRRTLGLRREEVALLAGVSVSWYTWLEQGRDIRASTSALGRISEVLHLSRAEVVHLFTLASELPPPHPPEEDLTDGLNLLVAAIDPVPAYVRNSRWDILAWNTACEHMFLTNISSVAPPDRNALRLFFLDESYRRRMVTWEQTIRGFMESFRMARSRAIDKGPFDDLVEDLYANSAEFREWWPQQDVRILAEGVESFRHPKRGLFDVTYVVLNPEGRPDLSLVTLMAKKMTSARRDGQPSIGGRRSPRPPLRSRSAPSRRTVDSSNHLDTS